MNVSSASYGLPLLSCCQTSLHKDCQLSHSQSRSQKIVSLFKYTLKPSECTSGTSKNFLPSSYSCLKIKYLNKSLQLNKLPARVWDVITSSCNHLKSLRDYLGVSLTWLEGKEEKKKNTLPLSLWLLLHTFFLHFFLSSDYIGWVAGEWIIQKTLLLSPRRGFLNHTLDKNSLFVWGGWSAHCKMFSSVPTFYPLYDSSISSLSGVTTRMSLDIAKCSRWGIITPAENPYPRRMLTSYSWAFSLDYGGILCTPQILGFNWNFKRKGHVVILVPHSLYLFVCWFSGHSFYSLNKYSCSTL